MRLCEKIAATRPPGNAHEDRANAIIKEIVDAIAVKALAVLDRLSLRGGTAIDRFADHGTRRTSHVGSSAISLCRQRAR